MPKQKARKRKQKKLRILAAGDIHGSSKQAEKLAEKAKKEKADLIILTGDITGLIETKNLIKPFTRLKKRVLFVPGNWDSQESANFFENFYGIKNLDNYSLNYGDIGIFGAGNENLDEDDKKMFNKLKRNFNKIKNLEKKIMVTHLHPAGTKSELSGWGGNKGIRKAIDKFKPDLVLHSHIHELEGAEEEKGKTKILNVGRKGKIIEI